MNRRDFIQLSGVYLGGGGLMVLSANSHAVWPWIARIIFTGLRRFGARSMAPRIITNTTKRSTFKSIAEMSIVGGSIISVSPSLFADINKYKAQAIWVNEGVENNFYLALSNNSSSTKGAQLSYQLRDIDTGKVEIEQSCGYLSAGPSDEFKFSFSISELPYVGAKQLIAGSDSSDLHTEPSGAIIVATQDEVYFNEEG